MVYVRVRACVCMCVRVCVCACVCVCRLSLSVCVMCPQVLTRSGLPHDLGDLQRVAAGFARTVLLLQPEAEGRQTDRWMTDRWAVGWMVIQTDRKMDRWKDRQPGGRTHGHTDGQTC
jgi:hypothetical protein